MNSFDLLSCFCWESKITTLLFATLNYKIIFYLPKTYAIPVPICPLPTIPTVWIFLLKNFLLLTRNDENFKGLILLVNIFLIYKIRKNNIYELKI